MGLGGIGFGLAAGAIVGAALASSGPYYGYGYYPAYSYGGYYPYRRAYYGYGSGYPYYGGAYYGYAYAPAAVVTVRPRIYRHRYRHW